MTDGVPPGATHRAPQPSRRGRRSAAALLTFAAIALLVYLAARILVAQGNHVPATSPVDSVHSVGVYIGSIYSADT